jgi:hypothetical protein
MTQRPKMRKPILYQIQREVLSEKDLRMMIEGVIKHRENYILYGSPYAPYPIDNEIYDQKVVEEENERIKHEQRIGHSFCDTVT